MFDFPETGYLRQPVQGPFKTPAPLELMCKIVIGDDLSRSLNSTEVSEPGQARGPKGVCRSQLLSPKRAGSHGCASRLSVSPAAVNGVRDVFGSWRSLLWYPTRL